MIRRLALSSRLAAGPALLFALAAPAFASSGDAWEEFRSEVEATCLAAAADTLESPSIVVDPFGSESYGLAVLTGLERGGSEARSVICAFDKQSKKAETGGALDLIAATPPAGEESEAITDEDAVFEGLAEVDREALLDLPARISRTLAAIGDLPESGTEGEIVAAAGAIAEEGSGGPVLTPPDSERSGEARCTLRWFGFLENSLETVGRHQCRIETGPDGAMVVEKLTGEGMRVEIQPMNERYAAFVGRSFLPEQTERDYDPERPANEGNDNFGNVVGFATEADGLIHLIGGDERGMSPPDDTFFSVLTIDRP